MSRPDTELSMSELGEAIGKKPGVFQRGLNSLEKQGLVVSRRRGNMRLCRANPDHALFEEVKGIVAKTHGVVGTLKLAVSRIGGIETAMIYGSYAKGAMRAESDIDLLVVCDSRQDEEKLLSSLADLERRLHCEINYKRYSKAEFARKQRENDPFLREVLGGPHIAIKEGE